MVETNRGLYFLLKKKSLDSLSPFSKKKCEVSVYLVLDHQLGNWHCLIGRYLKVEIWMTKAQWVEQPAFQVGS